MRQFLLIAIIALTTLTAGASYSAADHHATAAKGVTNKVCPLMGDEVNPKIKLEHEGQYVYFCCSGCIDMFKADPQAAIAKMTAEDKAAIQKNATCPMSGEPIEKFDVRSEHEGRFVYFCGAGCKAKFDKEHAAGS